MSASVFRLMIRDSGLPPTSRHLLRVVAEYAEDVDGWPTTKQLADAMGLSIQSIWMHTAALRDQGWLEKVGGQVAPRWKPAIPAKILPMMVEAG